MTDRVKFAALLVEYRGRCGWSQSELAEKIGVHRNTIASWESGTIPSRGVMLRLSEELLLSREERKAFLEAAGFSVEHWPADYWNVPYSRNPYFIGRETVLQSLQETLVPGAKTTALTQSISGLGGIGKTQVAIEYAHHYGEHYEAVLWIPADSLEVATAACLQLATEVLGLPEQQEAQRQIAEIKRWLQKHHGWLLILDNAENPQEILSTFVPSKHQGSVLVTTRRRDVGPLAYSVMLPLLSEDDAVLFLLRRASRITKKASVTEATTDDFFLARDLCQLLGRLPLALDQAGAYIAENGCSLQRYIDLYEHYRPRLLDHRGSVDHPDSVLKTFWISWEQIQQRKILAGKVLQFCSFLAPDHIPESLIQAGLLLSSQKEVVNDIQMDEAIGLLHRHSLVKRVEHELSLHRLVQEVLQEVLSEEEQQQWMERAVVVVNTVFPNGEHGTWSLCESLLPHALVCAKWTLTLRQKKLEGAQLLNATGRYLCERAQYEEAEPLYQQALLITEEQLGTDCPDMAVILNNLAGLYRTQGRYEEAEPLFKRTLFITEEQLGPDCPDMAVGLNNLALLYYAEGRYEEAEPLCKRALLITEEQLGPNHPETAFSLNNLALLYHAQGQYEEAEPLYQRSLSIREVQLGADHPETASSLTSLALLYHAQGRYEEAEPLCKRALLITEEQLGPNHPESAIILNNLALLYYAQGRYEEAEPLYQRSLSIQEVQLGADHPSMAIGLNNIAKLYYAQGRYEEAEPLYQRAVEISVASLSWEHPQTQEILRNHLRLLSHQYTNGDLEALLQLLAQGAQDEDLDGEEA